MKIVGRAGVNDGQGNARVAAEFGTAFDLDDSGAGGRAFLYLGSGWGLALEAEELARLENVLAAARARREGRR